MEWLWMAALVLAIIYTAVGVGTYITFRILDFPDLTAEGSFVLGAAIAAVVIRQGLAPEWALLLAIIGGALSGLLTGLVHIRMRISPVLASILVMTGLYTLNLRLMERSNLPLRGSTTLLSKYAFTENIEVNALVIVGICVAALVLICGWVLRSDFGLALRSVGQNPRLSAAMGISIGRLRTAGVMLANGVVGFAGALMAQYQMFADVNMGFGVLMVGIASLSIGGLVVRSVEPVRMLAGLVVGATVFQLATAGALRVGLNPFDMKLATAVLVVIALAAQNVRLSPARLAVARAAARSLQKRTSEDHAGD